MYQNIKVQFKRMYKNVKHITITYVINFLQLFNTKSALDALIFHNSTPISDSFNPKIIAKVKVFLGNLQKYEKYAGSLLKKIKVSK